ncbi:MAG: hypothetical protein ABI852_06575 [Gemmatimonadaceae bacterium]
MLAIATNLAAQTPQPELRLVLVNTTKLEAASPATRFDRLDVNSNGLTVMKGPVGSAFLAVVVDTLGNVVTAQGRAGSGPGELRTPSLMRITSDAFFVLDVGTMRISKWSLKGQYITSTAVKQLVYPVLLTDDGMLAFLPPTNGPLVNLGNVSSGDQGAFQSVVTSKDPPLSDWFPQGVRQPLPAGGVVRDGYVLGDPLAMNLAYFDRSGRLTRKIELNRKPSLPSAARVDRQVSTMLLQRLVRPERAEVLRKNLLNQPVPHFHNQSALREDSAGRIWALGMEGDSAVAHVFSPSGSVASIPIPCPGFEGYWSLAGQWLAVACAPRDDDSPLGAVRMLFRVQPANRR